MGETTRTDEEIELAELRELSAFFKARRRLHLQAGVRCWSFWRPCEVSCWS